jgi:hypothetical protein
MSLDAIYDYKQANGLEPARGRWNSEYYIAQSLV